MNTELQTESLEEIARMKAYESFELQDWKKSGYIRRPPIVPLNGRDENLFNSLNLQSKHVLPEHI
jgi:hypothetical protein